MQTFDQALFDLVLADRISIDQALRHADSMNDLRLAIKLHGHHAGASKASHGSLEIL
jgi:twitching motility protein PilU